MFVITGLGVGGAERQVVDLADKLAERGHSVKIAYLTGPVRLNPSNTAIEIFGLGINRSVISFSRGLFRLVSQLKDFKPDVVHSHMGHANIISRLSRLFVDMPCLISSSHSVRDGGYFRALLYRVTDRLADISTNVGSEAVRAFEHKWAVPRGRMVSVVNGVDLSRFYEDENSRKLLRRSNGLGDRDKVVLAVGRFYKAKDYPNLLRAFSIVSKREGAVQLWIAGDGPLLLEMQGLAKDLHIDSVVKFLGVRKDIPDLMRLCDVFALSSEWEGLPLVVGEAMASSKVVVATDCGGVREFLGDCGLLVSPRNHLELAEALCSSLSLPPLQVKGLGQKARARIVECFSLESAVNRWLAIYNDPASYLVRK